MPSRATFSSSPVACCKRRPKRSRRVVAMCSWSRSSARSRRSLAFMSLLAVLSEDELGLHGELAPGEAHRLARQGLWHAGQLEHHAAGLDDGDPTFRVALAGAHAGLRRLLRDGLVRIDVDPHLAATLDLAGHGDTCGLDLAVGEPTALERLQAVLAELHGRLGTGEPADALAVLLAVLDALRGEHYREIPPLRSGRSPPRPPPPRY